MRLVALCLALLAMAVAPSSSASVKVKHAMGRIVAVPDGAKVPKGATDIPKGIKMNAKDLVKATREARKTGKPVLVHVPKQQVRHGDEGATTVWRTADVVRDASSDDSSEEGSKAHHHRVKKKQHVVAAKVRAIKQQQAKGMAEAGSGRVALLEGGAAVELKQEAGGKMHSVHRQQLKLSDHASKDRADDEDDEDERGGGRERKSGKGSRSATATMTLNPTSKDKEEGMARHRKLIHIQPHHGGDLVTGDGARPTRQPVDEVSKLVAMLPYAFVAVIVAVVFVVMLLGRVMKMRADESSSYFAKDGMQDKTRVAPKRGGFGRRY